MRLSAALLLTLTACGHRYGADCDTGEDCRSGLCAYVTDPVCSGAHGLHPALHRRR